MGIPAPPVAERSCRDRYSTGQAPGFPGQALRLWRAGAVGSCMQVVSTSLYCDICISAGYAGLRDVDSVRGAGF